MRYFSRRHFLAVLVMLSTAVPAALQASAMVSSREDYSDAIDAIRHGQWDDFEQLRSGLDDYPLAIYLDYHNLTGNRSRVRPAQARRFISLSQDTPLPNRFLSSYLHTAGKQRRWADFLAVMPDEPVTVELRCYYFRAKLGTGDTLAAWQGAERLWVHGRSRPRECDPLFQAWLAADQLSDDAVWARALQAFAERQRSLLRYVSRHGSEQLQPWTDKLQSIYVHPDRLRRLTLSPDDQRDLQIAEHGLVYLARYNPVTALAQWRELDARLTLAPEQRRAVEYAIARHSMLAGESANYPWLQDALARLADDELVAMRLRRALESQDWDALEQALPLLSAGAAGSEVWRYWRAVLHEQLGQHERAQQEFRALAGERDYYGFLAADKLDRGYTFNNQPLVLESARLEPLKQLPAVKRIEELNYHQERFEATSEWVKLLQGVGPEQQESLALLASQQGWYRMSIDAANHAQAWDRLALRFPLPYREAFEHHATAQGVPSTELMAIARRESAFFPEARSAVGARGLMQVMPATGRQVARRLGQSHSKSDLYEVEHNILLGSAYYRQLLDRYGDNRVFALSAYNAGPHRVDRWRTKNGQGLPVDIWVETIPFRETRNYVKAVLAYNVVFQHMLGLEHKLLTVAERQAQY